MNNNTENNGYVLFIKPHVFQVNKSLDKKNTASLVPAIPLKATQKRRGRDSCIHI